MGESTITTLMKLAGEAIKGIEHQAITLSYTHCVVISYSFSKVNDIRTRSTYYILNINTEVITGFDDTSE